MIRVLYIYVFILLLMIGCKSGGKESTDLSSKSVSEWISNSGWSKELTMKPDKSINLETFVLQNKRNEKAWKVAFEFLKRKDLNSLAIGRYDLSDDGTYATVSEYETKEHETARYEAHRKYIDIQYVCEGDEFIELLSLDQIIESQDYDEKADIMFFYGKPGERLHANREHFFVFFPNDAHKPCLKIGTPNKVRKVVIKIPVIN